MKIPLWVRYEEVAMEKIKEYAFSTILNTSYEDAISKVKDALMEEGFGVLTEIDVKATLKKKLNVDFRKYVILGACNPPYAYRTFQTDLDVGRDILGSESFFYDLLHPGGVRLSFDSFFN